VRYMGRRAAGGAWGNFGPVAHASNNMRLALVQRYARAVRQWKARALHRGRPLAAPPSVLTFSLARTTLDDRAAPQTTLPDGLNHGRP